MSSTEIKKGSDKKGSESFFAEENDSDPFLEAAMVSQSERRYAVNFGIEGDAAAGIALDVFWQQGRVHPQVFFCVPGGGMNRKFFDLGGEQHPQFSFARQMAARGYVSVLVDPPAIGGSDRPEDGFALTAERIADILGQACRRVVEDLQQGLVDENLAAMPGLVTIGLGHSMGSLLTVMQQHRHHQHVALVLMGFGTRGLPQFLPKKAQALLDDQAALRAALPDIARQAFASSYPVLPSDGGEVGLFGSTHADPVAVKALKAANDVLLAVPATMAMLPGNVAPECAALDVPVYLAIGEKDMVGKPEKVPPAFSSSPDVRLQVLEKTGHSHFLFPAREQLFDALAEWVGQLN